MAAQSAAPMAMADTSSAAPKAPSPTYGRRASQAPQEPAAAPKTVMENCLLVDDSRMIRKIGRQIVEKHGFKVSEAENGQEALEKCRAAMPDLIILDWDMPIMTGIEFLAALRAEKSLKQPKVVFCTTHSDAQDIHQAIELGANDFCVKPFNEDSLLAKLKNIGAV